MIVRVEVAPKPSIFDARGAEVVTEAATLGISGVDHVEVRDLFFLSGEHLDGSTVGRIVATLLMDAVVADASWMELEGDAGPLSLDEGERVIEVAPLPGVTDSVAESLMAAVEGLGIDTVQMAATGTQYRLRGDLGETTLRKLAAGLLANEVIQSFTLDAAIEPPFVEGTETDLTVETVTLLGLDDDGLVALSNERRLSLNLIEMRAIQGIYERMERNPRDAELEMFAQTWSEHCVHKTFKAKITLTEDGVTSIVDSMFKTWIYAATHEADKPWLRSVFVDNAGIVAFDENFDLAFKAETHNHPSALEPFGGANTGVGGVIRDVMGVSARPIACTDVLCFGPPDLDFDSLPEGVLHPRRIASGVIAGVGDYGNKMGIPTVDGAIRYDAGYTANPLVYCGCLGVLPTGSHPTSPQPGDIVVSLGGRTGRDGLRGATFSSMEMDVTTSEIAGTSVQIGHPIHEKQALEVVVRARDEKLYSAITDCGAGGLSSAVGEMGETLGADIHLDRVPLKYSGLRPWEIWLSEAQERMVLAVPPANWDRFVTICEEHGVEPTPLGNFRDDGRLIITHGDVLVVDLTMHALHEGIPQREMVAEWVTPSLTEPALPATGDFTADLLSILATPNVRSKEEVVRTFDHEVQGGTIVKPFVGVNQVGPSDATVLRPLDVIRAGGSPEGRGCALSSGINPNYGKIDPYHMAWAVVDEAVRNAVCVGADPTQMSLLDNFCWGNPNLPDRLAGLVRSCRGCYDAAVAFDAPFISGKDSLNNEYTGADGEKHAIPGTLLISALSIVPDVCKTCTMDFKAAGNQVYVVGETHDEMGGSAWYELHDALGANVPQRHLDGLSVAKAMYAAISGGHVRACHDASEGGLAVAIAEMAHAGGFGVDIDLAAVPFEGEGRTDASLLFSETMTRYLVEVRPDQVEAFEAALSGFPVARLGAVTDGGVISMRGIGGGAVVTTDIEAVETAWRGHV